MRNRRRSNRRTSVLQIAAITFTAIPLVMGCAAVAAAIGANAAVSLQRAAAVTYSLIETHGSGDSDIRDYGLSSSDCRARLFLIHSSNRESAYRFTCEAESVASN